MRSRCWLLSRRPPSGALVWFFVMMMCVEQVGIVTPKKRPGWRTKANVRGARTDGGTHRAGLPRQEPKDTREVRNSDDDDDDEMAGQP